MNTVSLVVRTVVDGKRANLYPKQAKARNLSGTFYTRGTEDAKDKWVSVGKDASAAKVAVICKEREFRGAASTTSEVTLPESMDAFILERTASQDASSVRRWQWELNCFGTVSENKYLRDINREDVFAYWNGFKVDGAKP